MSFIPRIILALLLTSLALGAAEAPPNPAQPKPPNILFCLADDWGLHAKAYGCDWIRTPNVDALAREGLIFDQAYTPTAKCSTSRASLLTGRNPWLMKEAANHYCDFPAEFKTWMEALGEQGWHTGYTGKGWGPGTANDAAGKPRQLTGPAWQDRKLKSPTREISSTDYAANFKDFLDANRNDQPWAFWFGCYEPHRDYEKDSGISKGGFRPESIDRIPGYWPDTPEVRGDLLDYAFEVQYFDRQLGFMIAELKARGLFENTLIVVTSDNGMPFPRVKGNVYEAANHLPFLLVWQGRVIQPGRHVPDLISFIDLAPTFFEAAGLPWEKSGLAPGNGRSLLEFCSNTQAIPERQWVLLGKERTDTGRPGDVGYPTRSLVTDGFMLIHNYEPSRWPAGNPETDYRDVDASPTKLQILQRQKVDPAERHWRLCFGMRPKYELYKLKTDPDCVSNLADDPAQAGRVQSMASLLTAELTRQKDPRALGEGAIFDSYTYTNKSECGLYEKWLQKQQSEQRPAADAATTSAPAATKPNIIFILCDDLGCGDVGVFFQNQRAARKDRSIPSFATPQIDSLGHEGVMLTQHYCGAPVCASSRGSLLTGLTQGHCGIRDNQFDKALPDTLTLGSILQKAGYATAAIGKWGLQGKVEGAKGKDEKSAAANNTPGYPTRRGFDHYFGYVAHRDGHAHYPKEDGKQVWENDREISQDLDLCYTADLFTARTKKWIVDQKTAKPEQPFFIYLAYDTPHAKLQNPPCPYPAGGGLSGGLQWTGKPHAMINAATGKYDDYMFPEYAAATWDHDANSATPEVPWPDVQKRFANDVRRIDFAVGDILQLLKDLKIDDNTLVVFSSDNGPSMESYLKEDYTPDFFHGFGPHDGIKRDTLEGGVVEPTLARWPGVIPAGRVDATLAGQWNWLCTFAEIAGLPLPAASDGVSLLPSLTGKGTQRPGALYIDYSVGGKTPKFDSFSPANRGRNHGVMQNIYLGPYKGLRCDVKSADDDFEIFEVLKDPQEAHNLGKDTKFAALQAEMKAKVLQMRKPDPEAARPYDKALIPAIALPANAQPGLLCSTYAGQWPWMPQFATLTAATQEAVSSLALPAKLAGPCGLAFDGFVNIPADGEYLFNLDASEGAMLFLHEIRLIDADLKPGATTEKTHLKAGWHPIRLYCRHSGAAAPKLQLSLSDAQGQAIPLAGDKLRHLQP